MFRYVGGFPEPLGPLGGAGAGPRRVPLTSLGHSSYPPAQHREENQESCSSIVDTDGASIITASTAPTTMTEIDAEGAETFSQSSSSNLGSCSELRLAEPFVVSLKSGISLLPLF